MRNRFKLLLKLWPLLLPLAFTGTLYSQCHGVIQLQYNGVNIGTASTMNFVCPGGGGGGGGGGTTFSGDVATTTQTFLSDSLGSIPFFDTTGFFFGASDGTAGVTVTANITGTFMIQSGQRLATDTITTSGAGSMLIETGGANSGVTISPATNGIISLTASGTGYVLLPPQIPIHTDNVTSSNDGAVTIQAGTASPVRVQDTAGLEIWNDGATTGTTLTCTAAGVLTLKAAQTFATDNITSSGAGALNLFSGTGGTQNINLTPSGTGNVDFATGRTLFADAGADVNATGQLWRHGNTLEWSPNGTFATDNITNTSASTNLVIGSSGTIRLVPATNQGVQIVAGNFLAVDLIAAATTSGDLTLEPQASGGHVKVPANDIMQADTFQGVTANGTTTITANGTGRVVYNGSAAAGTFWGLTANVTPTGDSITLTCKQALCTNSTSVSYLVGNNTYTASCATSGPALNGRDQSGTFSNNTWIYVYIIGAPGSASGLILSQSSSAPTLTGLTQTYYCLVSCFYTGGGTNVSLPYQQFNRHISYNGLQQILNTSSPKTAYGTTQTSAATRVPPISTNHLVIMLIEPPVGGADDVFFYSIDGASTTYSIYGNVVSTFSDSGITLPLTSSQGFFYKATNASDLVQLYEVGFDI